MTRTREEWVRAWRASGLSGTQFATENGLAVSTLYWWGRTAKRLSSQVEFTEVKVASSSAAQPASRQPSGLIEIELTNGRVVRVHGDIDRDQLRRLLEVVDPC